MQLGMGNFVEGGDIVKVLAERTEPHRSPSTSA